MMAYDVMVISAHPDDAEVQLGGTIALLTEQGMVAAQGRFGRYERATLAKTSEV